MTIKKKILTSAIALTTLCSTAIPYYAQASSDNGVYSVGYEKHTVSYDNLKFDYKILQDDKDIRRVEVTATDGTSTIEFNKKTGEYTLIDSAGDVYENKVTQSDILNVQNSLSSKEDYTFSTLGTTITNIYLQQDKVWFAKCKIDRYDYTNPTSKSMVWQISHDSSVGKPVLQSPDNETYLNAFQANVKTMLTKEIEASALLGGAYAAGIAALLTAAPTLGLSAVIAILAGAGAVGTGAVCLWEAYDAHKDAIYNYKAI